MTFKPSLARHTFEMNEVQAEAIHKLLRNEIAAYKNRTASQVESGNFEKAQEYVKEMRKLEAIAKSFNMEAKHTIAEMSDKPLVTSHKVEA